MVWIHVAAAAVWIGASVCVLIVAAILPPGGAEREAFAARGLPVVARMNLGAAALVFVAGLVRFVELGAPIKYRFSATFLWVLGAKIVLFTAMALCAVLSYAAHSGTIAEKARREAEAFASVGILARAAQLAGFVTVGGGLAAALGLWLAGST
jgi:putative copper export protein